MNYNNEEDALAAWDKEHGEENQENVEMCPGCGEPLDENHEHAKMSQEDFRGQTLLASIKDDPSGRIGVVVDLPDTKTVAYLMLLSIIQTMSLSGGETFDDVMAKVAELNNKNALSDPKKYDK